MSADCADIQVVLRRLDKLEAMLAQALTGQVFPMVLPQHPLSEVERIKQQALALAREGKRDESVALMKSLTRRTHHA